VFSFVNTPELNQPLHEIDRAAGDPLDALSSGLESAYVKRMRVLVGGGEITAGRLQSNVAMTEATESSIMEGASATRRRASELLRSGKPAATVDERMILNNLHAMQLVKSRAGSPLSPDFLLELQDLLVRGTLADSSGVGRWRTASDDIRIIDARDESVIFVPPDAGSLPGLLRAICNLANNSGGPFIHPVLRASILHFLIGYAHPFVDGNGRTARAVFYWSMLRAGYGLFEYLSISEIVGKGYAKYPQAFLDVELDEGDLTYFLLYKLDVIRQAMQSLAARAQAEEARVARSGQLIGIASELNLRQRLLLEHALRHPLTQYTVKSHANSNGIVLATARADLEALVKLGLLTTMKRGKEVLYIATPKLPERVHGKRRK